MGLQNHLSDVSTESLPILVIAVIANCLCYLQAFFFAILHFIGLLQPPNYTHQIQGSPNDVVGSGLASVVLLAEQLNLNRVLSYTYHGKGVPKSKCVVCLNHFGDGENVRKLACRHVFHKDCFDRWLDYFNFSCPLCRLSLVSDERVEITRRRIGEDGLNWFGIR